MRIKTVAFLCWITGLVSLLFWLYRHGNLSYWEYLRWEDCVSILLDTVSRVPCIVLFYLFYKKFK